MKQWIANKLQSKKKLAYFAFAALMAIAALPTAAGAAPIDFTGTTTGVSVTDVTSTGISFMNIFGEYTMLILGVIFSPVIIGFLIWLMKKMPKFSK
jgi:hypothetical protein